MSQSELEKNNQQNTFESNQDMGIVKELFVFLWQNKLWWMLPIFIVIAVLIVLITIGAQSSTAAPFIYTLF